MKVVQGWANFVALRETRQWWCQKDASLCVFLDIGLEGYDWGYERNMRMGDGTCVMRHDREITDSNWQQMG